MIFASIGCICLAICIQFQFKKVGFVLRCALYWFKLFFLQWKIVIEPHCCIVAGSERIATHFSTFLFETQMCKVGNWWKLIQIIRRERVNRSTNLIEEYIRPAIQFSIKFTLFIFHMIFAKAKILLEHLCSVIGFSFAEIPC